MDVSLSRNSETDPPPLGGIYSRASDHQPDAVLPNLHPSRQPHRLKILVITGAVTLLVATAVGLVWALWERAPVVTSILRFTNDGARKHGPLLADSSSLYFEEIVNGQHVPVSVPLRPGGKVVRLDIPLKDVELLDLNQRSGFLISARNAPGKRSVWSWIPGHDPKILFSGDAGFGAWISGAEFVGAARMQGQFRLASRSGIARTISLLGWIEDLRWSPARQALRFTMFDSPTETHAIWEMRGLTGRPQALQGYPVDAQQGAWSRDGKLFVFVAKTRMGYDLWADYDTRPFLIRQKPVRLTSDPTSYSSQMVAEDGATVFALGTLERPELVRYDAGKKHYEPFLDGLNAIELDFSRDGRWIAYVASPERTLWKIRTDGSERVQLTFGPLQVIEPRWSPDGARIAFMGQPPGGRRRIYLVPASGGTPVPATSYARDQGVPTWSPDGARIVFGELLYQKPQPEMTIRVLDLEKDAVEELPGARGHWTPRWSPDGRYISALTPDFHKLLLFDCQSKQWAKLEEFPRIDYPAWTRDSAYIYSQLP